MSLELALFAPSFSGGRLSLRCVAQVADLYLQETELALSNPKDPVPERGEGGVYIRGKRVDMTFVSGDETGDKTFIGVGFDFLFEYLVLWVY